MSKCDTMKVGEVLRLQHRETEEVITVRVVSGRAGEVRLATDADQRWIITRVPVGERESGS